MSPHLGPTCAVPRRIVVIRPGALGDTLLAFPALALLRRRWPRAHLTFVARGDVLSLARASRLVDGISAWEEPEWSALFAAVPPTHGGAFELLAGADVVVAWLPDVEGDVARTLNALGVGRSQIARGRPAPGDASHAAYLLAHSLAPLGIAAAIGARGPGGARGSTAFKLSG